MKELILEKNFKNQVKKLTQGTGLKVEGFWLSHFFSWFGYHYGKISSKFYKKRDDFSLFIVHKSNYFYLWGGV